MTTVGDAVDRCFRVYLDQTYERDRNSLANPVDAGDDTITLKYAKAGPAAGGLIAIGRELCAVIDTASNGRDLTVLRGIDGTFADSYDAGRLVEINPRYGRGTIVEEMYWELKSWPDDIYRVARHSITSPRCDTAFEVVDLDARIRRVLDVQRPSRASTFGRNDGRGFRIEWRAAYDVSTEGDAWVYLDERSVGSAYRVIVGTDWPVTLGDWNENLDLQADVGMTEGLIDALVGGATWRIVFAKEISRLQLEAQGQARDPQEIPAGALARLGLQLRSLRDGCLDTERARLVGRYGFG